MKKAVKQFVIPNMCKNTTVLLVMVVTQLWVILVTLLGGYAEFFVRLGVGSLYCHWIALSVTMILCATKEQCNKLPDWLAMIAVAVLCLSVFAIVEIAGQYFFQTHRVQTGIDWQRFIRFFLVAILMTGAVLRVLSIATVLDQRSKAEVESRVQALQSRIRPHFLFNSLNTIAELTRVDPAKAEDAIGSLSALFRAGLETDERFHSLEQELRLCRRYIALEQWRLDSRLRVDWNVQTKSCDTVQVPKLILQPLIENAIVHGTDENGHVTAAIGISETAQNISITIENSLGHAKKTSTGHGIAVQNIQERLFVIYDDSQTFRVKVQGGKYRVLMRFPKTIKSALSKH